MPSEKFIQAIQLIDKANQDDPNQETVDGESYPKELLYAQRMTAWLEEFQPNTSEALQLAARAQHICRWEIPRDKYPMNKVGYHAWRNQLKKFHAEKTSTILQTVGYDQAIIDTVSGLIQKKQLKKNKETQTLEDVICLVFLAHYSERFFENKPEEKIIDIIQKTWRKMSVDGQQKALQIKLPDSVLPLVQKALA